MESQGLFQKEENIIKKYNHMLETGVLASESGSGIVRELLNDYLVLLDQMKKVIKISDRVHGKMNSALRSTNEMLDEINRDLLTAQTIQSYFIKTGSGDLPGSNTEQKHSHIYLPSQTIGGDFINIDTNGHCQSVIIADVEGHGITAAIVTGVLKSSFAMLVRECGNLPDLFLQKMNLHLFEVINTKYATCYYAFIDTLAKTINLAKAGHPHPFFWNNETGSFIEITASGPGLGIIPDAQYKTCTLPYNKGDKILFFTDGILEQRNDSGEMYYAYRVKDSFAKAIREGSGDILKTVLDDFRTFSGSQPDEDDITMLLYEF
jgi:serine phosphatase RsbU (regulator of sigma subunit)